MKSTWKALLAISIRAAAIISLILQLHLVIVMGNKPTENETAHGHYLFSEAQFSSHKIKKTERKEAFS